MRYQVFIIAEAGVNHNGSLDFAKKLAKLALDSGADAVKYQTFIAEDCISAYACKAEYQKRYTQKEENQLNMVKKLQLSFEEFMDLEKYCKQIGIQFISTPFDLKSIGFLQSLDMPFWKIPSGEVTNVPYLIKIAQTGKDVVMSTGMCTLEEVEFAVNLLKENGTSEISLLHCNTEYPTPYEDVNLRAMFTLKEKFNCKVGYSDHTEGIEVPIAAVAMGAEVIEKHFTLDKNMEGPDHKASLEPKELKAMVCSIRNIEKAIGDGDKEPSKSEINNIEIARKSIVASRAIKKGEMLTEQNLTVKRPGNGVSPIKWFDVLGTLAVSDFAEDELIML